MPSTRPQVATPPPLPQVWQPQNYYHGRGCYYSSALLGGHSKKDSRYRIRSMVIGTYASQHQLALSRNASRASLVPKIRTGGRTVGVEPQHEGHFISPQEGRVSIALARTTQCRFILRFSSQLLTAGLASRGVVYAKTTNPPRTIEILPGVR